MMLMTVTVMLAVAAAAATENPHISPALVVVKQGSILGSRVKTSNGFVYYTFSTIPYARPPVGHLRFQDPKPAPAWSGVRNGSLPFPKCPQSTIFKVKNYDVDGQEDCLYLNVFTPRPYRSNLPVMVFIHGGALVAGSALGPVPPMLPVPLLEKDVVVVTMNYRLGALGFLSTGDGVLPGNLGFKDQTLALRWVQDNIGNLGGDPKKVTIFGVSAGAFSCHAHTLSPSSAGLFQRAILQSGTALLSAQFGPPQKGAIAISKALNCKGEESHQLLACFKAASVEDLVEAQSTLSEWYDIPLTVGAQVDGTFLPDFPAALLKSGRYNKVDLMVGWTRDDGDFITAAMDCLTKVACGLPGPHGGPSPSLQCLRSSRIRAASLLSTSIRTDDQRTASVTIHQYDAFRHHRFKYRRQGLWVRKHHVLSARLRLGYQSLWQVAGLADEPHYTCSLCCSPNSINLQHYCLHYPAVKDLFPRRQPLLDLC